MTETRWLSSPQPLPTKPKAMIPIEKYLSLVDWEVFDKKIHKTGNCWNWTGRLNHFGYGVFVVKSRSLRVSRLVYERQIGPIPKGLTIDHLCRNRRCVRPSHLEAVPNRENILRGVGATAVNSRKTHCKRGHEFSSTNTYQSQHSQTGDWRRECRICLAEKERQRPARKR